MSTSPLRVLQVGAGSMGTRRLRDLSERADVLLSVYDERPDRVERARERFKIAAFGDWQQAIAWQPDALVISTPPDQHREYVALAIERGWHHFCEAHIWTPHFEPIEAASVRHGAVAACSCSMAFLPVVQKLKEVVRSELGDLHAYQMFLSTWLPDWHPWEQNAFYAWRRPTCAAREMVPFELAYLSEVFGHATSVAGSVSRRGRLETDSEDTWCLQMNLAGGGHGQLVVLMASPGRFRRGACFGSAGAVTFDIAAGEITLLRDGLVVNDHACGTMGDTMEPAYRAEIHTFIDAIRGQTTWPHGYRDSALITGALAAAETSHATGRWVAIDPRVQPADVPVATQSG